MLAAGSLPYPLSKFTARPLYCFLWYTAKQAVCFVAPWRSSSSVVYILTIEGERNRQQLLDLVPNYHTEHQAPRTSVQAQETWASSTFHGSNIHDGALVYAQPRHTSVKPYRRLPLGRDRELRTVVRKFLVPRVRGE